MKELSLILIGLALGWLLWGSARPNRSGGSVTTTPIAPTPSPEPAPPVTTTTGSAAPPFLNSSCFGSCAHA